MCCDIAAWPEGTAVGSQPVAKEAPLGSVTGEARITRCISCDLRAGKNLPVAAWMQGRTGIHRWVDGLKKAEHHEQGLGWERNSAPVGAHGSTKFGILGSFRFPIW